MTSNCHVRIVVSVTSTIIDKVRSAFALDSVFVSSRDCFIKFPTKWATKASSVVSALMITKLLICSKASSALRAFKTLHVNSFDVICPNFIRTGIVVTEITLK